MKTRHLAIVAVLLACLAAGLAIAADPAAKGKPQTVCPVMGAPINKNVYVDHQGQRIYFCCPGCIGAFQKEPEKYLQKMKEQGVTPEKTPAGT